eukprot:CAMPEP_0119023372 /NCGR_PEP_ID=MMETSP1176-20130426/29840_1 /TAXON_ID=265551 /ORGANISM="Synedropsis recta cf, Strain CCMP1620" /LENGTH=621 /DNA_ID=CAMNT_0006978445 /DNA_START=51 /DNA_END=1916 /DNA_ORIENTATION=+
MNIRTGTQLSFVVLLQWSLVASAFSPISYARSSQPKHSLSFLSASESESSPAEVTEDTPDLEQNEVYIQGLIQNLTEVLDRWVVTSSPVKKAQVQNILNQIRRESKSQSLILTATRLAKRGGFPMDEETTELGKSDSDERRKGAEERNEWENFRGQVQEVGELVGRRPDEPRSALSRGRDLFMGHRQLADSIGFQLGENDEDGDNEPAVIERKSADELLEEAKLKGPDRPASSTRFIEKNDMLDAQLRTSELVAKSGANFEGEMMGIGGLDDVLAQVKRRIWVPLAAPPVLLQELGISPVRGLLLYGKPGCGKTLIARTIGQILSPGRPVTVVSGPELMDKFVGSSEQNVRKVFDAPPPIFDHIRMHEPDDGKALSKVALHVIIMDEFDAMARVRGGKSGDGGSQGEAGVARDSVVNQILAKMDGVDPLPVPTLVIGMTNKRSLIDPALLRPGRFEVQIEVPPPRTQEQRVSILKVHMKTMFEAGRLLVRDARPGTAAYRQTMSGDKTGMPTFEELLDDTAAKCLGFSGASLAGVARAAASHALERAVTGYSAAANGEKNGDGRSMLDCLVTQEDLQLAIKDVVASSGDSDWADDDAKSETKDDPVSATSDGDDDTQEPTV